MDAITFQAELESHTDAVVFVNATPAARLASLVAQGKGQWSTPSAKGDLAGPPRTILLEVKPGEEVHLEAGASKLKVSLAVYLK